MTSAPPYAGQNTREVEKVRARMNDLVGRTFEPAPALPARKSSMRWHAMAALIGAALAVLAVVVGL